MALQSILHDPNISSFLDQIPINQRIITLKQLIYIGIKIVSNSVNSHSNPPNLLTNIHNKQNTKQLINKNKTNSKFIPQEYRKSSQNDKKFKKSKQSQIPAISHHSDKIQSTLLRQISKIRVQLQSLTNKVYDHYFVQNQQSQSQDSLQLNEKKDNTNSYGFNRPSNIPTFSPNKLKQNMADSYQSNPFLKQKNNFFNTNNNQKIAKQTNRGKSYQTKQIINQPQQQNRGRTRSQIMHLDDRQVRQALYKQTNNESEAQKYPKNKQKKSHSMIEKRHQQKKKDQENYFYQLNIEQQSLKQLQKFKQSKNQPDDSYRDFVDDRPPKIDYFKKKAKSKIKPLVQRDRLKYQSKIQQQNFQKGFEQYEYSANENEQNQEQQQQFTQNQQQQNQNTYNKQQSNFKSQANKQQKSAQQYNHYPEAEAEYDQQKNASNPNFGFYDSKNQSEPVSRRQDTFNNNQSFPDNPQNFRPNQSSFSQFSQFSMSSSNSKRQIGKISRRKQQ